jgi:regulatory protein
MREHSRLELRRKLSARAVDPAQLDALLDRLAEQGMQSDLRFAQGYVNKRARRGFGPLRIRMELAECGIDAEIADACVDADDEVLWDQRLLSCVASKFGKEPPAGYNEWAKRARFLEYRGFPRDHIRRLLRE